MSSAVLDIKTAAEVFLAGFTRHVVRCGSGVRRDAPRLPCVRFDKMREGARFIADEFVIIEADPAVAVATVRQHNPTPFHYLSVIGTDYAKLVADYAALGYRATEHERLMVRSLAALPAWSADARVQRVHGPDELALLDNDRNPEIMLPIELEDGALWQYYIMFDAQLAAWGRTTDVGAGMGYVAGVRTVEAYRRRGLARALMQRMLYDCAAAGQEWSVLTASPMGLPLYQALGYTNLGALVVFEPDAEG